MAGNSPTTTKLLKGRDRAKFLALSEGCGSANQLERITARLRMNKFVMEHGAEICQATFDAIMKRAKKK